MQEGGEREAEQREREARDGRPVRGEAQRRARARGEEHVREGGEHAAEEEGDGERTEAALHQRSAEVEDVLDEREPGGDDRRVDDAVDRAVEGAAPDQQHQQDSESLRRLLDKGSLDHGAHEVRAAGLLARGVDRDLHAQIDQERDRDRARCSPQEREPESERGLGLPAVDPAHAEEHHGQRHQRNHGADRGGAHAQSADDVGEDEQQQDPEQRDSDRAEHGRHDGAAHGGRGGRRIGAHGAESKARAEGVAPGRPG
ncbi:hypothetical protein ACH61_03186 [Rathayibacter tanaceti]|uniref:Uncharacterized protein n=1 Tax=Rathayibacter tanaceti TaxID=1671680 RepID=A0A166H0M0_9MICO|nr:hypothetical protein ACH61_03186 [Rathayibacter tanaceti]